MPDEHADPRAQTAAEPAVLPRRALAGPLLALLTVLTWSTYSIASSLSAAQGFRPWDMTLLRFAGGALLVLPFLPPRRIADLDGLGWRRGVGLALAGGPLFGLTVYSAFALAGSFIGSRDKSLTGRCVELILPRSETARALAREV